MLREVENLYWYDGPVMGIYEDVTGQRKLLVRIAEEDAPFKAEENDWIMFGVNVTEQLCDLVRESHITLKQAFLAGKKPFLFDMTSGNVYDGIEVKEEFLPGDCYLDCRGKCRCGLTW